MLPGNFLSSTMVLNSRERMISRQKHQMRDNQPRSVHQIKQSQAIQYHYLKGNQTGKCQGKRPAERHWPYTDNQKENGNIDDNKKDNGKSQNHLLSHSPNNLQVS